MYQQPMMAQPMMIQQNVGANSPMQPSQQQQFIDLNQGDENSNQDNSDV
jgi:hypothetical protein